MKKIFTSFYATLWVITYLGLLIASSFFNYQVTSFDILTCLTSLILWRTEKNN